ncbi:MAG: hypothetical protein RR475_11700 [Clostridia bacterium]
MLCFPLDNTEYMADALGAWCGTRTRGVFASDGHYAVTYNDNMTVTVSPGLAWLKAGTYWGVDAFEANAQVLTLATADGSLSRIDAVCVRLDKNRNKGEIVIKKGAYAPQPPTIAPPVRNLDFDEIYVATILVRAGTTIITQNDITDQRLNEEYCGLMRDGVTGIPTQQLYAQWMSWMTQFKAEAQTYFQQYQGMVVDLYTQYVAEIAVHGKNAQQVFDDYVLRISTFEQKATTDFNAWFATIRGILDAETAGHLLNLIQALPDKFYLKEIADQRLTEAITAHNTNPAAHGDTRQRIADLEIKVNELEIIIGPAISTNPFTVTFTTLAGKIVAGVWNNTQGRVEF